jgi:hypothetical protein
MDKLFLIIWWGDVVSMRIFLPESMCTGWPRRVKICSSLYNSQLVVHGSYYEQQGSRWSMYQKTIFWYREYLHRSSEAELKDKIFIIDMVGGMHCIEIVVDLHVGCRNDVVYAKQVI